MTFHSQLTRSFLHLPFCEVPQTCLPGTLRHGTTAQFGAADLCGPKNIARQINEMTWGLKRWDLTIQTGSNQIRSEEWKDGVMCSWDLATPPTSAERYHFFHECSKYIGTWSWHSLLSKQYDCGRTVVVEIWAKHCSPSNLVDLRVSQHLAKKRSWSRVSEDLFHNSTRRLIMMLQVPCQTSIPEETQNQM